MANRAYKRQERVIAEEFFGGQRTHTPGVESQDGASALFSIEAKGRGTLPEYVKKWMEQAERNATGGRIPVVIWHEQGSRHKTDFVIMRLSTFSQLVLVLQDFYQWMVSRQEEEQSGTQ